MAILQLPIINVFYVFDPISKLWYRGAGKWETEQKKAKLYRHRSSASNAVTNYNETLSAYDKVWKYFHTRGCKTGQAISIPLIPSPKDLEILEYEVSHVPVNICTPKLNR